MGSDSAPPTDAGVAQGLSALKRKGGSVLVVGAATDAQHAICDRFGAGAGDEVLVATDRPVRQDDAGAAEVIERDVSTRSATAAATGHPSPADDIRSLTAELETAMRAAADTDASLHICFDSIRPFVDATDAPTLVSTLSSLRETARETGTIVHLHLPAVAEAVPQALFDAVDAVVEVRRGNGTTYQRWRFPAATGTTGWVEV